MTRCTRLYFERLDDRCLPSFSPAVNYAAGANPQEAVTADFNNDSILDVAVANTSSGTVSVLLGNANGTLQAATSSPTGNQPSSLAVGDFNEDGNLDLVTGEGYPGNTANDVTVLLGNGSGMFGSPAGYAVGFGFGVDTVAVGDFNADGNLDLAVTSLFFEDGGSDGSYVGVMRGTGAGTFTNPPVWPWEGWTALGGTEFLPDSVVADFNADGKLDIAAPSFHGQLPIALGNGDGTFASQWVFSGVTEGSSIVAADFNADGKVDLAVAGLSSVGVLLGNSNGYFGTTRYYNTGAGSLSDLAAADFNGDGRLDVIASNSSNGTVRLMLGNGDGTLRIAGEFATGMSPRAVTVGDFNRDGRRDVAVANAGSNTVSVLLNDGIWLATPSLQIDDATLVEWNSGAVAATFTVTLSPTITQSTTKGVVTVAYATADGTAAAGSDYQAASGVLSFAPGEISKTITVQVNGDRLGETNETFFVNLSNATNAVILDSLGVGTIMDDEPRISLNDVSMLEGNQNQTTLFTFTVTLSAAYDQAVTVSFRTVDGTAKASKDFVAQTGTLTFAPGETTKTISIQVKGNNKREPNKTFYVDLFGNSGNSLIIKSRGIGTIMNDD